MLNYADGSLDHVREMLLHPRSASGLGDGGAHCGVICDASLPTFLLTWGRDRTRGERLPIELLVKKQTLERRHPLRPAQVTGTVEPGMVGDLNVIDFDRLRLGTPRVVNDLPAGGSRSVQGAEGYVGHHQVRRRVTFEDGVETGARPGRLVRGAR